MQTPAALARPHPYPRRHRAANAGICTGAQVIRLPATIVDGLSAERDGSMWVVSGQACGPAASAGAVGLAEVAQNVIGGGFSAVFGEDRGFREGRPDGEVSAVVSPMAKIPECWVCMVLV
jgi:hypothetical protein